MSESESDALATVRFAIVDAIAQTYGRSTDDLVDAIIARVGDQSLAWAFQEIASESKT